MSFSSRWVRPRRVLVAALAALVMVSLGAGSATAKPQVSPTPVPPNTGFGVSMPDVPADMSGLSSLTSALGRAPRQVMWYVAWSSNTDFPATQAAQVAATGAVPVITWEPWNPANGVDQPAFALDRITAGDFSAYETSWAKQIKAYGKPVVLRFAHEMNGNWYPWSAQTNGNTAGDYVAAWRHVRSVFSRQSVTNVTWSWSPNVPYSGSTDLSSLYPGDAYVDQVALDGYNWGTTQPWSTWTSFWDLFSTGVTQLQTLTSKPLFIAEVASAEAGGSKAAWIADMFAALSAHPEIRGFTWFHHAKETDWRIDSSASTLDAFRTGLSTYSF